MKAFRLATGIHANRCQFCISIVVMVFLTLSLATVIPPETAHAQAAVAPWLAAADPFEKFVNDVLQFSEFLIKRQDELNKQKVANAAPELVKSMHEVAAKKRALAKSIRDVMDYPSAAEDTGDLSTQTNYLDNSVRHLAGVIDDIDPNWTVQHSRMDKDIDNMYNDKASVTRDALYNVGQAPGGKLNRSAALKLAVRLDQLADKLDAMADRIAVAIQSDTARAAKQASH